MITASGTGTTGLDTLLTVSAKDAGTGTASNILSADYAAFGPATLSFNPGDGSSIDSTTATLTVTDDRRLEGNETVNLFIDYPVEHAGRPRQPQRHDPYGDHPRQRNRRDQFRRRPVER
jgi:hypothetical protein